MRPAPAPTRRTSSWLPPRDRIRETAIARSEPLAAISRLIGKHSSYLHRYIEDGVPQRLAAADRDRIERYLGLPAGELCEDHDEYQAIIARKAAQDTRRGSRRLATGARRI